MRRVVLHPSSFAEWLGADPPPLRREFEDGQLEILVPRSFLIDALGALASRGWSAQQLTRAGEELERIGFHLADPPTSELAGWLARGIPEGIAAYAALASWHDVPIAVAGETLHQRLRALPQEPA